MQNCSAGNAFQISWDFEDLRLHIRRHVKLCKIKTLFRYITRLEWGNILQHFDIVVDFYWLSSNIQVGLFRWPSLTNFIWSSYFQKSFNIKIIWIAYIFNINYMLILSSMKLLPILQGSFANAELNMCSISKQMVIFDI